MMLSTAAQSSMSRLAGKTLILGVGAQRAGTTWLYHYLAKHPLVAASPIKELHFFDTWLKPTLIGDFDDKFRRRLERLAERGRQGRMYECLLYRTRMITNRQIYFEYFENLVTNEPFFCEVTPSYCVLDKPDLEFMKEFVTSRGIKLKLIFLMRDPVDRYLSFLSLRAAKIGKSGDFLKLLNAPHVMARSRYDLIVENLRAVFRSEEVHIGFYEHLFANPNIHLRAITDFIGIDYLEPPIEQKLNSLGQKPVVSDAEIKASLQVFAPVYDFVNRMFGAQKPTSWRA